ncbi:MAG: SLBB domain-containing protein [Actinomycetota bacterium]
MKTFLGRKVIQSLTGSGLIALLGSPVTQAQILVPPPPPGMPTTLPPMQSVEAYTLGAGDRIQMDIYNVPEYSGENGQHQILADGYLNLPLVGKISVAGLTLDQAAEVIKQRYTKYIKRPWVTVRLLAARPLQIAVAGEVHRPGSYTVAPPAGATGPAGQVASQLPTVTRALQMAGGITPSAEVRQIKIRRSQREGPEQIINVDLWELLQNGDLRADITLRDGDSIFVPTATDLNRQQARTLADANFAGESTQPISVAVVGEVARPGTYTLSRDFKPTPIKTSDIEGIPTTMGTNEAIPNETIGPSTVTKAIKLAGGITSAADLRQIQVRRITRAGTEQLLTADLWQLLQTGDVTQDIALQQGDTVVVPKAAEGEQNSAAQTTPSSFSPDTIRISVVGEVFRPGAMAVPPNTSLNQALVAAGGFNKARAETNSVDLIRLNPNGTVSRQEVPINFATGVNDQTNPILRNNDVIMVRRSGRAAFSDKVGNTLAPLSPVLGIFRLFDLFR